MKIGKYRIVWRGVRLNRLFPFWIYKAVPGFKHISEYGDKTINECDFTFDNIGDIRWYHDDAHKIHLEAKS